MKGFASNRIGPAERCCCEDPAMSRLSPRGSAMAISTDEGKERESIRTETDGSARYISRRVRTHLSRVPYYCTSIGSSGSESLPGRPMYQTANDSRRLGQGNERQNERRATLAGSTISKTHRVKKGKKKNVWRRGSEEARRKGFSAGTAGTAGRGDVWTARPRQPTSATNPALAQTGCGASI